MQLGTVFRQGAYWSSVRQQVVIPAGATYADLSFYYLPVSTVTTRNWIHVYVFRANDGMALMRDAWWDQGETWKSRHYDLRSLAGQTVIVHFSVDNDGVGVTALYLDDVVLCVASNE